MATSDLTEDETVAVSMAIDVRLRMLLDVEAQLLGRHTRAKVRQEINSLHRAMRKMGLT